MSSDPLHSRTVAPVERRPAIWPWLLLPLVTLTLFYILQKAKDSPPPAQASDAPQAITGEDSGSR
ncbi:MAG TPA: hypothetical protein VGO53_09690 [Steroidobacteraceae bacterium]|jgi:hypothetical protein|nr:hypothetical protein [Steroidobacteraceae bacterium]